MKNIYLLIIAITLFSCKNEPKNNETKEVPKPESSLKVETINYEDLDALLHKNDNKTYIVNFWATWCKPCVDELPHFEEIYKNYRNQNVELILVSLDFPNHIDSRVIPFIQKHKLKGNVVVMGDPDQNTWIPKVSEKWSGAIPATVIYNKNKRAFFEQSFNYKELEETLSNYIN